MTERREKIFRFSHFHVAVSYSTLQKWAAVPVEEKCKIIASAHVVYAIQDIRWEGARVQPAVVARELVAGEQMPTAAQIYRDFLNQRRSTRKKLTNAETK